MKFNELGITDSILRTIDYENPTEIQEKTIPLILAGKDVIGESATGSGKTFAFGCGIVQGIEHGRGVQALVLTPTRELAQQVAKEITRFSRYKELRVSAVYGGVPMGNQVRELMHADVVIGTPGRILDHMGRMTINLSNVKILVLDEADRMLDMGFIDSVRRIIGSCGSRKQTMLFSATISRDIMHLAGDYMKDPVRVSGEKTVSPELLRQVYYDVEENQKLSLLVHLLGETQGLAMVFCNTKRTAEFVARTLQMNHIDAMAVHGGLTQKERDRSLSQFHSSHARVLVCTDVASRGLDIRDVSIVYNYDMPMDSKEYIHRIGRTARAGAEGLAINLISYRDHDNFNSVLRFSQENIEKSPTPEFRRVYVAPRQEGGQRTRHYRR